MTTQIEQARAGVVTTEMRTIAQESYLSPSEVRDRVSQGRIVIMKREGRKCGIGEGLPTRVNVNIGTSASRIDPAQELEKALVAQRHGADTLSELSMGGDIRDIRAMIEAGTTLPITTVPVYQTVAEQGLSSMSGEDIIRTITDQAREGISSMVLHTIRTDQIIQIRKAKRIMGVVSKGGSIIASWMHLNGEDNPHITHFPEILEILHDHDVVLSLGNSLRSGCIHDPRDPAQESELRENIRLARIARDAGVQTIIEWSGGHVSADRIADNIRYYKERSEFPLFVAGPLPMDVAVGYDHIAGTVGGSIAAGAGADYLCYLTPSEHLGLPTPDQVREGLIAFRIAAHIGDSIKYGPREKDRHLAACRRSLDWEGQFAHAIDEDRARCLRGDDRPCTMCGDFCALRLMDRILRDG